MRATGCIHIFDCQTALSRWVKSKESKGYRPLFMRWARGVPFVLPFRSPKKSRGMARRQGAWPGLLQTGPRVSRLPGEPGSPGPGVKRHPRALRRATEHLRAYALPTVGPHQELFVPGGLFPRSPVGRVASALPLPALRTSPEDAPRRVDRDGLQHNYAASEVKSYFSYGELRQARGRPQLPALGLRAGRQ